MEVVAAAVEEDMAVKNWLEMAQVEALLQQRVDWDTALVEEAVGVFMAAWLLEATARPASA